MDFVETDKKFIKKATKVNCHSLMERIMRKFVLKRIILKKLVKSNLKILHFIHLILHLENPQKTILEF